MACELVIATWNLERPVRRKAKLAAQRQWIERIDADIWVLTETVDDATPGPAYADVSTIGADRSSEPTEHWVSIWSRLPLVERVETSDPTRTCCARFRHSTGDLVVYGT